MSKRKRPGGRVNSMAVERRSLAEPGIAGYAPRVALPALSPGLTLPAMTRPETPATPDPAEAAVPEAARAAAFARKQRWKEQPGNRYTPAELQELSRRLGKLTISEAGPEIMRLD